MKCNNESLVKKMFENYIYLQLYLLLLHWPFNPKWIVKRYMNYIISNI